MTKQLEGDALHLQGKDMDVEERIRLEKLRDQGEGMRKTSPS
jgi:hypothetical protein